MINQLLFRITDKLPCRLISRCPEEPYLERYYLGQLFGVTFYLHRFVSSDREMHLHNHPWNWARALVLSGSYDEEYVIDLCPNATPFGESGCITRTRRVRWWNCINGNHFHRIANAKKGTWTLFFHGRRARVPYGLKGWGFLGKVKNSTVFTPFPGSCVKWHLTALKGRDSGREPL